MSRHFICLCQYYKMKLCITTLLAGIEETRAVFATTMFGFASGFIVMYDVTDIKSYNDVCHWYFFSLCFV